MRQIILSIVAAEKTESYNLQKALFEAVLNNDLDAINRLVGGFNLFLVSLIWVYLV